MCAHVVLYPCVVFGELSERLSVAMAFLGRDMDIFTRSTGKQLSNDKMVVLLHSDIWDDLTALV